MNQFTIYIMLIIFIKVIYLCLTIAHIYFRVKDEGDNETDTKIQHWKDRVEFVFVALMSFLLIYLFNPRANRSSNLDFETKLLLYILGFILLMTANWKTFIKESPIVNKMHKIHISK
jgi:hypothetical protein